MMMICRFDHTARDGSHFTAGRSCIRGDQIEAVGSEPEYWEPRSTDPTRDRDRSELVRDGGTVEYVDRATGKPYDVDADGNVTPAAPLPLADELERRSAHVRAVNERAAKRKARTDQSDRFWAEAGRLVEQMQPGLSAQLDEDERAVAALDELQTNYSTGPTEDELRQLDADFGWDRRN